MRAGYVWLLSFAAFPIAGAPLLQARPFGVFGRPTRTLLSTGVGMVLVSWTMTVFALLRIRWGPLVLLAAAALAFALRFVARGEAEERISPPRPGSRRITRIAVALITLSIVAAVAATLAGRSGSPDLLLFWGPKAQQFASARTIDSDFLGAPFMEYLHTYYPPLVTNVWALGTMIAGRFPWGAATLTFPILLAATAVAVAGTLRTNGSTSSATVTAALTVSPIALIGILASVAGNAEPFLLFFEIAAVATLLTPIAASTAGKLLAGLLLAGAAASKVEGLPFVLAAAAFFVLSGGKRARPAGSTLALLLTPTVAAVGSWLAFGESRNLFHGYRGYGKVLGIRWESLGTIASASGAALAKVAWGLPWLVPLVIVLLVPPRTRYSLIPAGTAVALVGFFLFTYLTTQSDLKLLILWSAARILSPVAALTALACRAAEPETPGPLPP